MLARIKSILRKTLSAFKDSGRLKGEEKVIVEIIPPHDEYGQKIKLNNGSILLNFASNSYLGIFNDQRLIDAEHEASTKYGVGPGAVRFISGTQNPHIALEKRLAEFYKKEASMIFSSAYAVNCGIIAPLVDENTMIISDELNHNSIIMAIKLAGIQKDKKKIYRHCDMDDLKRSIEDSIGATKRLIIATDGVFSMRGNYAPLDVIQSLAKKYDSQFKEGIITIVDDSHGIGAYGKSGRGTVEVCSAYDIDIITGTLGKALGVDGGFIVTAETVIEYLRETSPFYVYSNPISAGVSSAAVKALEILDSDEGLKLLERLKNNTEYFRTGIKKIGFSTIRGIHPIVPLLIGDPQKAKKMTRILFEEGIFVIALTYPVVPKGQDTIRVQISASHTKQDIEYALTAFKEAGKQVGIAK
jgi:glycine C-acetyltransferase